MGIGLGLCCCESCGCNSDHFPTGVDYLTREYDITFAGLIGDCAIFNGTHRITYASGSPLVSPFFTRYAVNVAAATGPCTGLFQTVQVDYYVNCDPATAGVAGVTFRCIDGTVANGSVGWTCGPDTDGFEFQSAFPTCGSSLATVSIVRVV